MNIKSIFYSWEKLRIIYNLVLLFFFAAISISAIFYNDFGTLDISIKNLLIQSFFLALLANVLYLAGPILDSYLRWLGNQYKYQKHIIFMCGLILSLVLEIGYLSIKLSPL